MEFENFSYYQRQACIFLAGVSQWHEYLSRRKMIDDEAQQELRFKYGEAYKKMNTFGFTWSFQNNITCLAEKDPYAYESSIVKRSISRTLESGLSIFKTA